MICFAILFLNLMINEEPLILKDTEIYKPLNSWSVAISSTGDFFLLARQDKTIRHYSKNGEALENIGRQGQGPGEYTFPNQIYCFEKKLFVADFQAIHIFEEDGSFIEKVKTPTGIFHINRISGGWVGIRGLFPVNPEDPTALIWFDDAMGHETTLATWSGEQERIEGHFRQFDGDTYHYNPARGYTHMVFDAERKTAVVSLSGEPRLFGFDMISKKPKFEIEIPGERIPFDEEGGKRAFEAAQEQLKSGGFIKKVLPDFPDYFPLIRSVFVTPSNQLGVVKWHPDSFSPRENRSKEDRNLYFNFEGKEVEKLGDHTIVGRIIHADDQYFYLSCYLETEEWSVARVLKAQAKTFIEAHPLPGPDDL